MNYKKHMEIAKKIKAQKGTNWESWAKDAGINDNVIHDVALGIQRFSDTTPLAKIETPKYLK